MATKITIPQGAITLFFEGTDCSMTLTGDNVLKILSQYVENLPNAITSSLLLDTLS